MGNCQESEEIQGEQPFKKQPRSIPLTNLSSEVCWEYQKAWTVGKQDRMWFVEYI